MHVLEDQVGLSAQLEVLRLYGQQLARRLKGAHLKVLAADHGRLIIVAFLCRDKSHCTLTSSQEKAWLLQLRRLHPECAG